MVDPAVVPTVLDANAGRVLLADLPGEDHWEARGAPLAEMSECWFTCITAGASGCRSCWRPAFPTFEGHCWSLPVEDVVRRQVDQLTEPERRILDALVADLPARFAALTECGLPDTLIHGDFHVGNVRGEPGAFRILDWSGCGVGHPLLDPYAFIEDHPPQNASIIDEAFTRHWMHAVPGADVDRAPELCKPIGVLLAAVMYQMSWTASSPTSVSY